MHRTRTHSYSISSLFQPKMVFSDLGETLIEIRMSLAYKYTVQMRSHVISFHQDFHPY